MKWQEMQFQHYNKKRDRMKIIGITGSSGAGKTTVCGILKEKYKAHIIDADEVARKLAKKGNVYLEDIIKHFGEGIVDEQGELKRKELADIIYNDNEKRNMLNQLTFNHVVKEIKNNINNVKDKDLIVIDAPLLFESNLDKVCDIVVGVIAKEKDKIERICNRDKINEETAKKRLNIQKDDNYIKDKSDYIIYNEGSIEKLEEDIEKIKLS